MSSREERIQRAKEMALDVTRFKAVPASSNSITDDLLQSLARIVADALDCCQKREPFHSFELNYQAGGPVAHESRLGFVVHAFVVLMREMEGRIIGGEEESEYSGVFCPNNNDSCSIDVVVKEEACMGVSVNEISMADVKEEEREVKKEEEEELFDESRVKIEEEVDDLPGASTDALLDCGVNATAAAAEPAALPPLSTHRFLTPKGKWQCPVCPRTYASEYHFNSHFRKIHPEEYQVISFGCNRCAYRSLYQKATEQHISEFCMSRERPLLTTGAHEYCARRRAGVQSKRNKAVESGVLDKCAVRRAVLKSKKKKPVENSGSFLVLECTVCEMRLAPDRYDLHFEVCHEKLWFSNGSRCSFPECDFRSIVQTTKMTHIVAHRHYDRLRFYTYRYLNCPFCQAKLLKIRDFTDHMLLWHLSIVSSKRKIHTCASCGFAAARYYEIVNHWKERVGKCETIHAFNADAL